MERTKEEIIKLRVDEFNANIVPFGYSDIKTAIEFFDSYGYTDKELVEAIEEFEDSTGTQLKDIDVCYIAYDYILQEVRNKINELIDFDINETGFCVFGNYMATSYDYTQKDKEELINAIKNATEEKRDKLLSDEMITEWFSDVDIEINDVKE